MKRSSTQVNSKRRKGASHSSYPQASDERKYTGKPNRRFWLIISVGMAVILLVGGGLVAYRTSLNSRIAELRSSCERARRSGDWPEMERLARQWASLEPERVTPWTMAAAAARAMGELEQCAQYLSQLPDTAPVEAFHELSLLQMETLVLPLAARDTCQRALKLGYRETHPRTSKGCGHKVETRTTRRRSGRTFNTCLMRPSATQLQHNKE